MVNEESKWTDHRAEMVIGNLLRLGVLIAALVVLMGAGIYLVRHGDEQTHYHVFQGEQSNMRAVSGIVKEAMTLKGRSIMQLGLLLLIATPVARVAFSVFVFIRERDYMYILVTMIVLSVLLYSLFRHGV